MRQQQSYNLNIDLLCFRKSDPVWLLPLPLLILPPRHLFLPPPLTTYQRFVLLPVAPAVLVQKKTATLCPNYCASSRHSTGNSPPGTMWPISPGPPTCLQEPLAPPTSSRRYSLLPSPRGSIAARTVPGSRGTGSGWTRFCLQWGWVHYYYYYGFMCILTIYFLYCRLFYTRYRKQSV